MTESLQSLPPCPFKARVLHSYEPFEAKEIPLLANTIVYVLRVHETGWWKGEYNGKTGWFPSTYVEPMATCAPPATEPEPLPQPERKPTFLEKLRALFAPKKKHAACARPAKDTRPAPLPEVLFGHTFQEVTEREAAAVPEAAGRRMPLFIAHTLDYLFAHGFGTEGLFRVPASTQQLKDYRAKLEADPAATLREFPVESDGRAVVLLGGLMKLFMREHPEPIWPPQLYADMLATTAVAGDAERADAVAGLLLNAAVPPAVRAFLCRFVGFMHIAARDHSEEMRMKPQAYATVFGPIVFTKDIATQGMDLADMTKQVSAMVFLISSWDALAPRLGVTLEGQPLAPEPEADSDAPPPVALPTLAPAEPAPPAAEQPREIVIAQWDYQAHGDKQLSLRAGQRIAVERRSTRGWFRGYLLDSPGVHGWFPGTYVAEVGQAEVHS